MATKDLHVGFSVGDLEHTQFETALPPFPTMKRVLEALPGIYYDGTGMGKAGFAGWVEFTLEFPDEVWDAGPVAEGNVYHYLGFFVEMGTAPAFAVEVLWVDGVAEVNDFTLVVRDADLNALRSGSIVYSLTEELAREAQVRLLNERALMKYDENSLQEADELLEKAIMLSGSSSAYLFNNRGLIHWKRGNSDKAKDDFRESIRLDPGNSDAHFNLGLIYSDEADFAGALRHLEQAVALEPGDSQYVTELGHLYLDLEREKEALELYGKVLARRPGDAQINFHLGYYFLYRRNRPRKAARHFSKGLETRPGDQCALVDLAVAHWILGHKHKCRGIQQLLHERSSLAPYTVSRLVYLSMETGDYQGALEYYRRALNDHDPFEPEWLHYHAALAYAKSGRQEEALQTLSLALEIGDRTIVEHALAEKALRRLTETSAFKELVRIHKQRRSR
jgi:tetratricopeptide (TPR) repeat protein